jgi:hypothetical protein
MGAKICPEAKSPFKGKKNSHGKISTVATGIPIETSSQQDKRQIYSCYEGYTTRRLVT